VAPRVAVVGHEYDTRIVLRKKVGSAHPPTSVCNA
jgi:hypothetical protein